MSLFSPQPEAGGLRARQSLKPEIFEPVPALPRSVQKLVQFLREVAILDQDQKYNLL